MSEKQYHIHRSEGEIAKYVLLPGAPERVDQIAGYLHDTQGFVQNREFRSVTGYTADGVLVSVCSTGIGCPSTAICVEELIAIGADTFIRIGTAGSLQEEIKVGDITISTGAVREDGTTRQYVPLSYPALADTDVVLALRQAAKNLGFPHHLGISHTKDAFCSEDEEQIPIAAQHKELWKVWRKAKVASTSMEASALFVVSSIRGKRAGEILANIGLTWNNQPIIDHKAGVDEAIKTAIKAVEILKRQE